MQCSGHGDKGGDEKPRKSYNSGCDAELQRDSSASWYSFSKPHHDKGYDGDNLQGVSLTQMEWEDAHTSVFKATATGPAWLRIPGGKVISLRNNVTCSFPNLELCRICLRLTSLPQSTSHSKDCPMNAAYLPQAGTAAVVR